MAKRRMVAGDKDMNDNNKEKTVKKALKAVAKQEGVSVESVRRAIEIAIDAARQEGGPSVQAFWESMPTSDSGPMTAEDIVEYFAQMSMDRIH
jgi:hypothetical protein